MLGHVRSINVRLREVKSGKVMLVQFK